ncbi:MULTISPECIES: hypothetical protein [Listeria]|uniref:Lmo2079 family surface lipoprotein n=1 Tax=Listeria TaxID=1637 RepID=UPI000B5952ED|nr:MULTISPECIES: hypothetical protein [Listeria]
MKKVIIGIGLLLLFLSLQGCSSPKSDFTNAMKKLSANKQFTIDTKVKVNEVSSNYTEKLGINDLNTTEVDLKISADTMLQTSGMDANVHWSNYSLHVQSLQNNRNGLIYIPVDIFYTIDPNIEDALGQTSKQVYHTVLDKNEDLQGKYLDFYSALQNISNQPIDKKTVQKQAKQINELEKETGIALYEFMNQLDDDRFKTNEDGTVEISIHKEDFVTLSDKLLTAWDKNNAIVNLLSGQNDESTITAKKEWQNYQNSVRAYFKKLNADKNRKLDIRMKLVPDSDYGISKLTLDTDYENKANNDHFNITTELNWLPYEKVPAIPSSDEIVTKKELDKVISDGLKSYLQIENNK